MSLKPKTPKYAWPWADVDVAALVELARRCIEADMHYSLGAKVRLVADSSSLKGKAVDCSGFVRYLLAKNGLLIPDGSVCQHEWCDEVGLKPCAKSDLGSKDGALRIAFLTPKDGGGVGHVVLIVDGLTCESHGGVGPDRRKWGSQGWMRKAVGYVVRPPQGFLG